MAYYILRANLKRGGKTIPPGTPVELSSAELDRLHLGIVVREATSAEARDRGADAPAKVAVTPPAETEPAETEAAETEASEDVAELLGESVADALAATGLLTLDGIRNATIEELKKADGIGDVKAKSIAEAVSEGGGSES